MLSFKKDRQLPDSSSWDRFRLLANFFCGNLTVIIFPTLLVDIQKSIYKSAQGEHTNIESQPSLFLYFNYNTLVCNAHNTQCP